MKIKYSISVIVLIIIALTQINCSSPSSEGKKAGEVFCDCMNGKRATDQSVSVLFAERDSCESLATKQLKTAEDKYQTDAEKLSEVDNSYINTTQKIYANYYNDLSKAITKAFSQSTWVREGTTSVDNYLFSFASNMITPLNESGGFEYKISGDTMVLSDDKKTRLLIHFEKDGKLSLSNPEKTSTVNYHVASTSKDKLIGYWAVTAYNSTVYSFKPDMSFYSSWDIGNYSWSGDEISFSGIGVFGVKDNSKEKLIIDDINKISLPSIVKSVMGTANNYCCDFSLFRTKSYNILNVKILYRN